MKHLALATLALLTLTPPAWSQEEALGRLFFTPERRASLDRQRQLNQQQNRDTLTESKLTLNGLVRRSTGRGTTWVNGTPVDDNTGRSGGSASLPTPAGATELRVGDTLNQASGEREDLLKGGSISVRRPDTNRKP